jgi:flagellar protein FlbT
MALKVELKADERVILGNCLVTNGTQRIQLLIEGRHRSYAKKTS